MMALECSPNVYIVTTNFQTNQISSNSAVMMSDLKLIVSNLGQWYQWKYLRETTDVLTTDGNVS